MTPIRLFSLGLVLVAACGELSRTPGVDGGAVTDGGTISPRLTCDLCTDGRFECADRECRPSCETPAATGCLFGERCVRKVCYPQVLETCEEWPCNANQACVSTYCLGLGYTTCDRINDPRCTIGDFCDLASGTCLTAPPCDADRSCRVGDRGAVCNTQQGDSLLAPAHFDGQCLVGRCTTNDHCPVPLTCQDVGVEIAGLGVCR